MYESTCAMALDPFQPDIILLGGKGYALGDNLNICRSTDLGLSWEVVYGENSRRIEDIHPDPSALGHYLAGGYTIAASTTPVLLESWDHGETWDNISWGVLKGRYSL